jgi:hypothetical protein
MTVPVQAPALFGSLHGIVEAGNVIEPGDDRWTSGVEFTAFGCEVVFAHGSDCWIGGTSDKLIQDCAGLAHYSVYNLETTIGWTTLDEKFDPKSLAIETMKAGTSSVLERLTEQGVKDTATIAAPVVAGPITTGGIVGHVGGEPPPNFSTALDIGGTAPDAKAAVGIVEAKLLDGGDHVGGAGTIYMNPILATDAWGLLDQTDGGLRTKTTGSKVVIGNFEHPNVYGHPGEVDVYLGDINVSEVWHRAENEHIVQAERAAVAVWNTCLLVKQAASPPTP